MFLAAATNSFYNSSQLNRHAYQSNPILCSLNHVFFFNKPCYIPKKTSESTVQSPWTLTISWDMGPEKKLWWNLSIYNWNYTSKYLCNWLRNLVIVSDPLSHFPPVNQPIPGPKKCAPAAQELMLACRQLGHVVSEALAAVVAATVVSSAGAAKKVPLIVFGSKCLRKSVGYPDAPCMIYLPTFGWFLGQMLVDSPYMEHLGYDLRIFDRIWEVKFFLRRCLDP